MKFGALLLSLVFFLCVLPAANAALPYNPGTRHELSTSLSTQAEAYYTGTYSPESLLALDGSADSPMQSEMFAALYTLMSSTQHTQITYNGSNGLQVYFPYSDANGGKSGTHYFYTDTVQSSLSREHVWPKSRASYYQKNGGADLHHLRPENSTANSTRGNTTMGDVRLKGSYTTYPSGASTSNAVFFLGTNLIEVKDNVKGDVARIFLYVWCRWKQPNLYENVPAAQLPPFDSDDSANDGQKVIENLETLLRWMEIDPVDEWEMGRNDIAQQVQGNRNVFIDYPELAWLIFDREVPADYPTPSGIDTEKNTVWGDADCNDSVTAADAALILRNLAGLDSISSQGLLNAETTDDNTVTAADAASILRYLTGL